MMTRRRRRVVGYRTPGPEVGYPPVRSGCLPALGLACLGWLVVGLPVLACVLGRWFR
jgi:hypothetical protein